MTFCLVLVASLALAGCGSKKEEAGGAEAGTSEKPVEPGLVFHRTAAKDLDKVMEKVSEYTKEKIGVTVKMKMFDWGDYNQKMGVIAASGEPFDIAFTSSWAFEYVANAKKGAFYELDDLMDQYGQDIKSWFTLRSSKALRSTGKRMRFQLTKNCLRKRYSASTKGWLTNTIWTSTA